MACSATQFKRDHFEKLPGPEPIRTNFNVSPRMSDSRPDRSSNREARVKPRHLRRRDAESRWLTVWGWLWAVRTYARARGVSACASGANFWYREPSVIVFASMWSEDKG